MRLLDRYLVREIAGYASLSLGVFLFILLTPEVLRLSELLARENIALPQLFRLFLSILPEKLMWAIPLGVLAGLLMGISRVAADCEVVALQAAGVSPLRLLRPALIFAGLGTALTLATTLWWWPLGARTVRQMQAQLGAGQVSYEVQPRVFDERFPNVILYVQDVEGGGARWKGVFLADITQEGKPKITLAESAVVVPEPQQHLLRLHLSRGSVHSYAAAEPDRYSVSTFAENLLAIPLPKVETSLQVRHHADLSLSQLWSVSQAGPDWRSARADFHRRLALPAACLVFGLIAMPLGLLAERSGRAIGFVLAIAVAISYYFVFLFGDRLAREGNLPPGFGVWLANLTLLVPLPFYLRPRPPRTGKWGALFDRARARFLALFTPTAASPPAPGPNLLDPTEVAPQQTNSWRLPFTLDLYVVRSVLFYFVLLACALLLLFGLFTVLEMVDDIAAHNIPWSVVARFLWYLLPQAFYLMAPLALLLAIMVELALLSKRNELVAIKGAGISLYRIALPVLLVGAGCTVLLFWLDNQYLPLANQQQEILRNQIKGRPPQTFFRAERRWIFGEEPRIYHYAFFDPADNLLARLNVLELDPGSFSLRRRLFAARAQWRQPLQRWVLEQGWERIFNPDQTVSYRRFDVASFTELHEPPAYFRKEVKESQQMNWRELGSYIGELRQSGFGVTRLLVQWHKKFAFPLIATLIALLAFPFGATLGARGAIGGLALGIALGFLYWVLAGFFEALGNIALLPPLLAAWGPNLIFLFGGIYFFLQLDT